VIIADPRLDKTPALLHAMGRIIERLGGRYIIADDGVPRHQRDGPDRTAAGQGSCAAVVAPAVWRVTSRMITKSASVVPTRIARRHVEGEGALPRAARYGPRR
jgi:hypothetical protein